MLAIICFAIATFFAVVVAVGGHVTHNPAAWAIVFIAAGLLVSHLPISDWPRR